MGFTSACIFLSCGLVVMGVGGYFKFRRRGPEQVRRFLIWYAFVWPFAGCGLCALAHPRLHWLYYVDYALIAASYGVQVPGLLRARAKARGERDQRRLKP